MPSQPNDTNEHGSENDTALVCFLMRNFEAHPKPLPSDRDLLRIIIADTASFCRNADRYITTYCQLVEVLHEEKDGKLYPDESGAATKIVERFQECRIEEIPLLFTPIINLIEITEKEFAVLKLLWYKIERQTSDCSSFKLPDNVKDLHDSKHIIVAMRLLARLASELHDKAFEKLASLDVNKQSHEDLVNCVASPDCQSLSPARVEAKSVAPVWDREKRLLTYEGKVCKKFGRFAPKQFGLLDEFQTQGWPTRLQNNPFSRGTVDYQDVLKQAIKDLEKYLKETGLIGLRHREGQAEWYPRKAIGNSSNSP